MGNQEPGRDIVRTSRESHLAAGSRGWLAAAALVGLVAFAVGLRLGPAQAWAAFLVSSFLFLTVTLGGLVFLAIMYVSNAGWYAVVKRVPEALGACLPVSALSMLVVLAGMRWLYPWTREGGLGHGEGVAAKAAYLNTTFFAGRMVGVLLLWVL